MALVAASSLLAAGGQAVRADVIISGGADGKDLTVEVTNDSRKAVADKLAEHFGLKVTGEIKDADAITARVRGDLKSVLSRLFGERNVMLVYGADGPEELMIINGSPSGGQKSAGTQVAADDRAASRPVQLAQALETGKSVEAAKPEKPEKPAERQVAVSGFNVGQMRPLLPGMNVNNADKDAATPPPAAQSGSDMAALTRQSEESLKSLVQALKALCPPGQTCG